MRARGSSGRACRSFNKASATVAAALANIKTYVRERSNYFFFGAAFLVIFLVFAFFIAILEITPVL